MKPGNILFPLRQFFDWALHWLPEKVDLYLRKPLYDCVFCMGSLWGMAFTTRYFALTIDYLFLLLQVAGLNYIIASILRWYHDQAEKEEEPCRQRYAQNRGHGQPRFVFGELVVYPVHGVLKLGLLFRIPAHVKQVAVNVVLYPGK